MLQKPQWLEIVWHDKHKRYYSYMQLTDDDRVVFESWLGTIQDVELAVELAGGVLDSIHKVFEPHFTRTL